MSIELETGLRVKTLDARVFGRAIVLLHDANGDMVDADMAAAASQIEDVLTSEDVSSDQGVQRVMPVLLSHTPTLVDYGFEYSGGVSRDIAAECLRPFVQVEPVTETDFSPEPVQFMGVEMSRPNFLSIVNYILQNTALDGADDPRLGMIERLRARFPELT